MNNRKSLSIPVKASLIAMALAFSGAALAAGEPITSKPDQNLEEKFGRDSVTALPTTPVMMPAQPEPQRYGRAGGFTGTDQVEKLKDAPLSSPSRAEVKSGESATGAAGPVEDNSAGIERFHTQ